MAKPARLSLTRGRPVHSYKSHIDPLIEWTSRKMAYSATYSMFSCMAGYILYLEVELSIREPYLCGGDATGILNKCHKKQNSLTGPVTYLFEAISVN